MPDKFPPYYRPGDPVDKILPYLCPTCGGVTDPRQATLLALSHVLSYKKCACPSTEPAPKHEQPIGFVTLDKLLEGSELEQIKSEVQAMMDAYDGSLPFPEYAEQYMQFHPSQWDFHALAQFLMPPNDPRNKPTKEHDGNLGNGDQVAIWNWSKQYSSVMIERESGSEDNKHLTPKQALSLRDWLIQESPTLERLAKEQVE